MSRVLVTGATGLIGRHAVAELAHRGWEVHIAARRPAAQPFAGSVVTHAVDLLNRAATGDLLRRIRPSHLLHFAWVTEHGYYWRAPENLDWVAATCGLVRDFAAVGGRRIVSAGTCAEYDWTDPTLATGLCHEIMTPIRPHTLYGATKDACRRILAAFADEAGLEFAWGRVFLLFGEGEDRRRLIPSIIQGLRAEQAVPCSPGTQVRDFMAAADMGAAFAALTASSVAGAVNIASGVPVTVAEAALTVGRLMGRPDLIHLGALPMRSDDPPHLVADVRRLRDEVGFPLPAQMEDRLRAMIEAELVAA